MFAAVLHEPKKLLIDELDAPQPQAGQVQIRVRAGGICGSDLSYYFKGKSGDFAVREPFVLGHEVAGEVASLGEGVSGSRRRPACCGQSRGSTAASADIASKGCRIIA